MSVFGREYKKNGFVYQGKLDQQFGVWCRCLLSDENLAEILLV
jgi:hypothetical protein